MMKRLFASGSMVLSTLAMSSVSHAQDDFPVLEGPYLGQKPPGSIPEPFAPGIVNTKRWGEAGGFSLDMNEFYVTRWKHSRDSQEPKPVAFKKIDNRWHTIAVPAGTRQPFHSPDGKTLHFGKSYKERTDTGWSEMKSLGSAFEEIPIMGLTVSAKGTLVLDEMHPEGNGVIRYSRLFDDKRENPKPFGKEINTGKWNAHPYIAADENYIMWDGERESGFGDNDIYISFRQKDGSWSEAINMGDKVNTEAEEGGPKVTPDGKYLFFNRVVINRVVTPETGEMGPQSDLYWVDAKIIEDLRPKNKNSTSTASPYLGQKPPGLTPEVFAPGIVSINGRREASISFSPDLDEIHFGANDENKKPAFYFTKLEGNKWTPIEKTTFIEGVKDEVEGPYISHDGGRIYFTAFSSDLSDTGIWYVNRLEHSWSDAKKLNLPVNNAKVLFLNQTKKGDLHYFDFSKRQTYYAPYSNGGFSKAKEFEIEPGLAHHFFSPNEDYFVAHGSNKEEEGREDRDVYVSFREPNGTWAKAINLGSAVNSNGKESGPTITPDGKYMFFGRDEEDGTANLYWVSTEVIENLRPKNGNSTTIASPYLGQKPPGLTPEVFAPGIVNTAENREIEGMFAADMKSFYFVKRASGEESGSNVLAAIEYKNDQWQESVVKKGVSEPSVSPDGTTLYFKNEYMERTSAGWSELKSLGAPFKDIEIMRLSASSNGTYYFDTFTPELDMPLRYSRLIDGKYEQPKSLGPPFAVGKYNAHPFIAPDESYVIWDSRREGGYGTSDLYISYRSTDGSWGPAINLGDKINTSHAENYPSVSPDGKFLFFDRRVKSGDNQNVDIFWVDAQFIEALRPK